MSLPAAAVPPPRTTSGHAIRLLGPLEVRDGGRVLDVTGVKRQAVLVLLVLHDGRPVSLERIIARLWPDRPPATAAAAVRNNISALRRLLAPVAATAIDTVGSSYVLRIEPGGLDAHAAREGVERGMRLLDRDDLEGADRELRGALALWRGGLLPALRHAGYRWAELYALEELRVRTVEGLAEVALRDGRHREVVPQLQRLVRQHPERESFHRQRVAALAGAGRPADAVAAFHEARTALGRCGRPVGAALAEAHRALLDPLTTTAGAAAGRPPAPVGASVGSDDAVTVLCLRFVAGAERLEQECADLATRAGAVVTRRSGGLVVAAFASGDGSRADGTDVALAAALAIRRHSRESAAAVPAIAVAGGRTAEPDGWRAGDTVSPLERGLRLVRRTAPGGVSLG